MKDSIEIPSQIKERAEHYFGEAGTRWFAELPERIDRIANSWSLILGPAFASDVGASYVARATRPDGTPCVLKVAFPEDEFFSGVEALRAWNGGGAVQLLAAAPEEAGLLLEYLEPGRMLSDLSSHDDDAATFVAANVMSQLWKSPPSHTRLIGLKKWFASLLGYRDAHQGSGRFDGDLLDRAEKLTEELLASTEAPKVLHGDLHHFNILSASRLPWMCIDPKGLVGDPGFEIAAFLRNPEPMPKAVLTRRLDILSSELGLERQKLRDWCFVEAMLNATWSQDEPNERFQAKVAWAELVLTL